MAVTGTSRRPRWRGAARALALVVMAGSLLAPCSSLTLGRIPRAALPTDPRPAARQPVTAADREHQRILTAYNGAYTDPRLEGLVNQTIAKLVAASDRPDMHYRVVI